MAHDRTGGSRRKGGVKPPVVHFSGEFSPISAPPEPFDVADLRKHAAARGFRDGDTPQAEYMLNRISYQHASSYFGLFEDEYGNLDRSASMKLVHRAILFDRKLQSLLMEYIGLFELQFRAQYSYHLSWKKGAFAHRSQGNFKDPAHYGSFLKRYEEEFNRQLRSGNSEIRAAYEKYGDVPVWMAVEIMSFGTLSMLYRNTKSKVVRNDVAASFGVDAETLASWSRAVSSARNQCAHFNKLAGETLTSRPKSIEGVGFDNGNPFYVVLIVERLLSSGSFFEDDDSLSYGLMMMGSVIRLLCDFSDVLDICRIPRNWVGLLCSESVCGCKVQGTLDVETLYTNGRIALSVTGMDGRRRYMDFGDKKRP